MPKYLYGILLVLLNLHCTGKEDQTSSPPNILFIISDDQGWTDYGFMGHPYIQTSRLDRLAAESLTFTRGYVAAPLCRPSLASMASGLYPHQHGITGNDPAFEFDGPRYGKEWLESRLPLQRQLQASLFQHALLTQWLRNAGYLTLQTGKWWEGSWKDGQFTSGMTHGDPARGGRHGDEGLKIGREGLQMIYDFIDTAQVAGSPFFIWYAPFMPHAPHTPPKELEEKYLSNAPTPAVARYWAMCEWFDQTCGDLLDYLDRKGLSRNTLVVYVCDNGWIQDPDRPNNFAPRSKRTPYEMGIRTPIMFRWPGKITPRMDTTTLAGSIDIAPTILAACSVNARVDLPGMNVLDRPAVEQRSWLFAEAYEHDIADIDHPTQTLQYRVALHYPWKLILPDTSNLPGALPELYNIALDPHEQRDLAGKEPRQVEQLRAALNEWWDPH